MHLYRSTASGGITAWEAVRACWTRGGSRSLAWRAFFSRESQALEGPAHRRDTAPEAVHGCYPGAQLFQGDIGRGTHRLVDHRLSDGAEPPILATRVWFRRHIPGGPVAAQEFFDK